MSANRVITIFLVLMLAGCGDSEVLKLQQENADLRSKLEIASNYIIKNESEYEHNQLQAGFVAGCNYIIPVCPKSSIIEGELAIKQGASGVISGWFWAFVTIKLFVLTFLSATLIFIPFWLWSTIGIPNKNEIKAAKELLAGLHNEVSTLKNEIIENKKNNSAIVDLYMKNKDIIENNIANYIQQENKARIAAAMAEAEFASIKNRNDALDVFKIK